MDEKPNFLEFSAHIHLLLQVITLISSIQPVLKPFENITALRPSNFQNFQITYTIRVCFEKNVKFPKKKYDSIFFLKIRYGRLRDVLFSTFYLRIRDMLRISAVFFLKSQHLFY